MADWTKKLGKVAGDVLQPGEELREGMFLQPGGTTSAMMARSLGGLAGAAIAAKLRSKDDGSIDSTSGIAGAMPAGPMVLGLTNQRLLVFGHSKLSGKPKDLQHAIPAGDLAAVDVQKGTATSKVTLVFSDGTAKLYEAPRIGNDPEAFAAAVG